jgi:predicted O-methyltransferase YrrM
MNINSYTPSETAALGIVTTQCSASVNDNLKFQVVVDSQADDPLTKAFLQGHYPGDTALLRLLSKLAPPGSRVLDLGGHIGAFSLMAAASGYEVVTVEASPRNAALIHASVKANGWSNMRVLNAGVSDAPGSLPFLVDGPLRACRHRGRAGRRQIGCQCPCGNGG